jgi:hypothetical protein
VHLGPVATTGICQNIHYFADEIRAYGVSIGFLLSDPGFVAISLSGPAWESNFKSTWPPLEADTRFAVAIWE